MRYFTTRNRAILREMISSDFKVRYQGSVLGYLWSLLRPLLMFAILYVVFVYIFKVNRGIEHYPAYLLFGIVLWNFFVETTSTGMSSIVNRSDLIRKISIPRYLVVLGTSAAAIINLSFNLIIVLIAALINGVYPHLSWLLFIPILLELFVFAISLAFLLATLFVQFRDMLYIWEVLIQAAFYGTPIIYALSFVPIQFHKYILLNPMAQIIQDARYVVITHQSTTIWQTLVMPYSLIPLALVAVLAITSVVYFKHQSKYFAENI